MKYNIFQTLGCVDKECRMEIIEDALVGKTASIPIKGLEDNFLNGIKEFLLGRECLGKARAVKVEFNREYDGEINFETDACMYLDFKGNQYLAWGKGYLQETDDEILLILKVSWDETFAQ